MKVRHEDLNKCGIYCIRNLINNKVYIGKSINIYQRITEHKYGLNTKNRNENRYLINAWHKYGENNFDYYVLEYLEIDENLLKNRELYWMQVYKSTDRNFGYNLRMDSSTKMIVHEDTRKLMSEKVKGEKNPNYNNKWSDDKKRRMSELKKQQYKNGEVNYNKEATFKGIETRNRNFKEHPESLQHMKDTLKVKNTKYQIYQYDKNTLELIKVWDYIADIIKENPTYKRHNIYAVCSGEKKSMYGYIWVKMLKMI